MTYPSSFHGSITRDYRENPIHDTQHVEEMHQIAKSEINCEVPEMIQSICATYINEAVDAMIGAIHYDIETTVEIAFKDLGEMYHDKRLKKFVSDTICKSIEQKLKSIKIKM